MEPAALLHRIENGRADLVEPLLASADGHAALQTHGAKLLGWCSYFGDVTACRLLLRRGLSLKSSGPDLGLNGAAFHGHWQLCEFLIESGADARYVDPLTGETPLHAAVSNHDRLRYDLVVKV